MTGQMRAELLKLGSIRSTYALAAGALGLVALNAVALVFAPTQPGVPPLTDPATTLRVYAAGGSASALVIVIGVLAMTTEFRYGTVTSTFLVEPRRGHVLAAKLVVVALLGVVIGVVCVVVAVGLASALLPLKPHASLPTGRIVAVSGGALLGYAAYAALGVSVGALVRNQVAAVVGALIWVGLVEALAVAFLPSVGKWLPGGALNGVLQTTTVDGRAYLPVWSAVLVLLAYTVVLGGLATRTTLRRDIT